MENELPVTTLMRKASKGDAASAEQLYALVYTDLHRIAENRLRGERSNHPLQATELVNEAFLRLHRVENFDFNGRTHYFAIAAQIMRRLLVDYARKHRNWKHVSLSGAERIANEQEPDVMAVDEALTQLSLVDAGAARIVEMKFFAGMTDDEVAEAIGKPRHAVRAEWNFAKVWLRQRLRPSA
jgi:RNA polymerase sigma factor (TIGR02999 family)